MEKLNVNVCYYFNIYKAHKAFGYKLTEYIIINRTTIFVFICDNLAIKICTGHPFFFSPTVRGMRKTAFQTDALQAPP